jgi:hypothetical protein
LPDRKGKQRKLGDPQYHRAHTVRAVPVLSHVSCPSAVVHYWLVRSKVHCISSQAYATNEGNARVCCNHCERENPQGNNPNHSRQQNRNRATPRESKPAQPQCQGGIQTNHHSTTTVPRRGEERECHKVTSAAGEQSIKQLHLHVSKPNQHKAGWSRVHQQPREPSQQLQVLQEKEGAKGVQCCRRAEEGQRGNVTMQRTKGMEECAEPPQALSNLEVLQQLEGIQQNHVLQPQQQKGSAGEEGAATTTTNREVQRAGAAATTATKRGEPRHEGNSRLVPERTAATTTTNSEVNEESTKQGNGGEGKGKPGKGKANRGRQREGVSQEPTN